MSPTPAGGASTGWAPDGAVIHDGWMEHDPANAEPALAELHAAASRNPAVGAAPRRREAARPRERGSHRAVARRAESRPRMTPLAGTDPGGRGPRRPGTPRAVRREHAERRRAADDPRRFQRGRTADAVPDEFGAVQALPRESAGDLVRIAGVTPGDRPPSSRPRCPPVRRGRPRRRDPPDDRAPARKRPARRARRPRRPPR